MKPTYLLLLLIFCPQAMLAGTPSGYQHGVIVKMHMGDCPLVHRGFMSTFGPPQAAAEEPCPEYTLVSEKVVFVMVGKFSRELVPLAEEVDFRFLKNELAMRLDDERHETRFVIKEMILRSQWELVQKHVEDELEGASSDGADRVAVFANRK
jgi:hypothetical protein